jgi:hypothetical protein
VISIWSTTAVTACPRGADDGVALRFGPHISFLGLQRTAGVSRLGRDLSRPDEESCYRHAEDEHADVGATAMVTSPSQLLDL